MLLATLLVGNSKETPKFVVAYLCISTSCFVQSPSPHPFPPCIFRSIVKLLAPVTIRRCMLGTSRSFETVERVINRVFETTRVPAFLRSISPVHFFLFFFFFLSFSSNGFELEKEASVTNVRERKLRSSGNRVRSRLADGRRRKGKERKGGKEGKTRIFYPINAEEKTRLAKEIRTPSAGGGKRTRELCKRGESKYSDVSPRRAGIRK